MKRLLTFLLSVFCWQLFAASGDVLSVEINTNGWAYVTVEGFPTNAVFNNGFLNKTNYSGTNEVWYQSPSTTNGLEITMFSLGYANGVRVQRQRTVYGTELVRKPYPDNAQSDIYTNGGGTARFHVALNDFVYATDSNLVARVSTNGFKDGSTFCNGTNNLDVSNGGLLEEWAPVLMHTRAIMQRIPSTTMPVSIVAFAHDGIDSVEFVAQGATSGETVTNTVTRMVPALNRNTKGIRWAEYQADMDLSAFTAGEQVRVDYTAWPKIGTNFSTFWNLYPMLSNQPSAYTNLYDPNDNVASWIAVVDSVNGNDSNGRATNVAPASVDAAHYFLTVPTALARSGSSNSWNGAMVYGRTDTTNIGGSTPTFGQWKSHPVLRPYPGDTITITTNNSAANTLHFGGYLQIRDATIAGIGATAGSYVHNARRIWLSNCVVDSLHVAPFRSTTTSSNGVIFVEDSLISRQAPTGFRQLSTEQVAYHSVGNNFGTFTNEFQATLSVGSLMTNFASTNLILTTDSSGVASRQYLIWYNNRFHCIYGSSTVIFNSGNVASLTNCAFVQNEFEGIKLDGTTCKQFSFSSGTLVADRVLWHHNTVLGGRGIFGYNTSATGPYCYKRLSLRNNAFMLNGWVTDNDGAAPSSAAVGNWLHIWGTGFRGNAIPNTHGVDHGTAEYAHFQSHYRGGAPSKSNGWWSVRSPKWAYSDGTAGNPSPGNGDYRWNSHSPVFFIPTVPLLDYDIDLVPRSRSEVSNWDPPGTSASGNAKKGGGFF